MFIASFKTQPLISPTVVVNPSQISVIRRGTNSHVVRRAECTLSVIVLYVGCGSGGLVCSRDFAITHYLKTPSSIHISGQCSPSLLLYLFHSPLPHECITSLSAPSRLSLMHLWDCRYGHSRAVNLVAPPSPRQSICSRANCPG